MQANSVTWEEGYRKIQAGVDRLEALLDNRVTQFTATEYMDTYTTVYNLCIQSNGGSNQVRLYQLYQSIFKKYIEVQVNPSLKDLKGEQLLRVLRLRWNNHKRMVRFLQRFFGYLDRYYVQMENQPNLTSVGFKTFKDMVFVKIKRTIQESTLKLIESEREGELIDRSLVKDIVYIFIDSDEDLKMYIKDFETYLLEKTKTYYQKKAEMWISEDSCPQYMIKAEKVLLEEDDRIKAYLNNETKDKLKSMIQQYILQQYQDQLINKENSGIMALLANDQVNDLFRMYRLYQNVPYGIEPIAKKFEIFITEEGMAITKEVISMIQQKNEKDKGKQVTNEQAPQIEQVYVTKMIDIHKRFQKILISCFGQSMPFHEALATAFRTFLNKKMEDSVAVEFIANYLDNLLRKGGSQKMTDTQIEQQVETAVKLLVYVSDKDLFISYYQKKLARRLLYETSQSDDLERMVIQRLKEEFQAQFTSKMEGMLNDLQIAHDKQRQFMDWMPKNHVQLPLELSVQVLTMGFWPTYKPLNIILPAEMHHGVDVFKNFYETGQNNTRKLQWIYSLGHCLIKGNFDTRPIELYVQTSQAAVLGLFNDHSEMSTKDIMTELGMNLDDTIRHIHSLCLGNFRILNKEPQSKSIQENDLFTVNAKFTHKSRRIKLSVPSSGDKKKTIEEVDKDRSHAIDAAVVRIMKSRKILSQSELTKEVIEILLNRFQADRKQIKKRIDQLISQEYLERNQNDPNSLNYLA